MLRTVISRRNLIFGAASVAASLLASCRGPENGLPTTSARPSEVATSTPLESTPMATNAPTPTPIPTPRPSPTPTIPPQALSVWLDPTLPARFQTLARQLLEQLNVEQTTQPILVGRAESQDQANVVVSTTLAPNPAESLSLATTYLVPVCSPRTPVRSATREQVMSLLSGSADNWTSAGSPTPIAAEPFVIDGLAVTGTSENATKVKSYADFVSSLGDHPGAIALASVDDVDFRAGSLRVDDVDLLAAPDVPQDWPFRIVLYVVGETDAWRFVEAATKSLQGNNGPEPGASPLTVTFVGDVILGRTVHTIMTRLNDYSAPFRLVADELKASDITIADLECSLSDNITPPSDPYTFSFMTFTAGADGLALSGVDAVSQANNHSMNFGVQGMRDTLAALDQRKIKHFGIGENLNEARKPVILQSQGRTVAFLGYDGITGASYGATEASAGTSPLNVKMMTEDIQAAREQADLVIPFVHWGIEYKLVPSSEQRTIARAAIDAGADMVVGSHCHWVQGMEVYRGKPIIYSLANFVFDQDWSLETKQGLIMHLVYRQNRLAALRFVPVLIEDFYRPRIVDGTQMTQILDRIWQSTDIMLSS